MTRCRIAQLALHFARDRRGGAAVLLAIAFPVLIGGAGLAAEASYWFLTQRRVQHAADLAAHAAAVVKRSGGDADDRESAALGVAGASGFDPAIDSLAVNVPPLEGAFAGDETAVEVTLQRLQPRFLTKLYSATPVPIGARAVAAVEGGSSACLLALSANAPGAVTISGSTEVKFDGCDVASNSTAADSFLMSGGAAVLSTGCVNTVGGAMTTAGLTLTDCPEVREEAPAARDPYADIAEPEATGACRNGDIGTTSGVTMVTPLDLHPSGVASMRFCSGLTLKGNVTLEPGLYIVEGGNFTVNSNANIIGSGVTFYLGSGVGLRLNGSATFNLSAPVAGPWSGLLFFGDRDTAGVAHQVNGTAASIMNGAIYLPAGDIDYAGDFADGGAGCTQIVASTVTFTGNSTLAVNCTAEGTKPIPVREVVRLVE